MRQVRDGRVVLVTKEELIEKIKENKENHIQQYKRAVELYRQEAKRQLRRLKRYLSEGEFNLKLDLVEPIDRREEYDKVVEMFEWEINDQVELSQGEFNQYVLDEMPFQKQATYSNTFYLNG